jgi:hypothetical protein
MIVITLRNNQALWEHFPIHEFSLKNIEKISNQPEEQIMKNCKKLLIESVRELTKCIKDIDFGGKKNLGSAKETNKKEMKKELKK